MVFYVFADEKWVLGPVDQIGVDEWSKLKRKAEIYFGAKKIENQKEMANIFLYKCGDAMIELFDACDKVQSEDENGEAGENKEFDDLVATLDKHFCRKTNVIFEVHQFRKMRQENGEKLEMFLVRLRVQAAKCGYKGDRLNEELLQMIAKGTNLAKLQDKLLTTPMTLEETMTLGKVEEDRKIHTQAFHQENVVAAVNRIHSAPKRKIGSCSACGFDDHKRGDDVCPAKKTECRECEKIGHYRRCCPRLSTAMHPSAHNSSGRRSGPPPKKRIKNSYLVSNARPNEEEKEVEPEWKFCFMVGTNSNKLMFTLGSIPVDLFVDSGAEVSIISGKTWNWLKEKGVVVTEVDHSTQQRIGGITQGAELKVTSSFTSEVQTEGFKTTEKFFVADNAAEDILSSRAAKALCCLAVGYNVYDVMTVRLEMEVKRSVE